MSTDQFGNITQLLNNIDQSTYVELIYTRETSGVAIPYSNRTVESSLATLAFGKKQSNDDHIVGEVSPIVAVPQHDISYRQVLADNNLSTQRVQTELDTILKSGYYGGCADVISNSDSSCPQTLTQCAYDIVFAVQSSTSSEPLNSSLQSSISKLLDIINGISGGNYRAGLVMFGDGASTRVSLTSTTCGNITKNNVISSLAAQYSDTSPNYHKNFATDRLSYIVNTPFDGGQTEFTPIDSTVDSIDALRMILSNEEINTNDVIVKGKSGLFRDNAIKIIVLILNRRSALRGSSSVAVDYTDYYMNSVADDLSDCGIKVIGINFKNTDWPDTNFSPYSTKALTDLSETTGGLYIESSECDNIAELLTTYFQQNCVQAVNSCSNRIINGSFASGYSGWDSYTLPSNNAMSAISLDQTMHDGASCLKVRNIGVKQTIQNLTPGNTLTLEFKSKSNLQYVAKIDDTSFTVIPQLSTTGTTVWTDYTFNSIIDESGVAVISFEVAGGTAYIDNVVACESIIDDCGYGTTNLVTNSFFTDGVIGWVDEDGNQLSETDSQYWDSDAKSILIGLYNAPVASTDIEGIIANSNMIFSFNADHIPHDFSNASLTYTISDGDNIILSDTIINSDVLSFPYSVVKTFRVPDDTSGTIKITFSAGDTSGQISIDSVMCCLIGNICGPDKTQISFDDFGASRGGWSGGILSNHAIVLNGISTLYQTFVDIPAGVTVTLKLTKVTTGRMVVELHSDSIINQFVDIDPPGVRTFDCVAPNSGVLTIRISNSSSAVSLTVDDILVCYSSDVICDGYITNVRTKIEWNGIPRNPVNIFGIIARYKFRNTNDPLVTEIYNSKSTSDGRYGTVIPTVCDGQTTCDFWKQNGISGIAESAVTSTSLNNPIVSTDEMIDSAVDGKMQLITSFLNWLWAIPASSTSTTQDQLITIWPNPPQKFVESVEFLLLVNNITPVVEVTPTCADSFINTPDPATSFDFIINYKNSNNKNREFRTTIDVEDIYSEQVTFESPPDAWDTLSAVNYGVRGEYARWISCKFELDLTNGSGLDQCTVPLGGNISGSGNLLLPAFSLSGLFADISVCKADIIVEPFVNGFASNTIQSVILPHPKSGFFTATFTIDFISNVAILPWNVDNELFTTRLCELTNIGSDNVIVTGSGTSSDPFLIEFVGVFAATNVDGLEFDSSNLVGSATGYAEKLVDGTINERQTISNNGGITENFVINFMGINSISIPYNSSINFVETKLQEIATIGVDNISVSGDIIDRDAPYHGPWYVDFIGAFAGQNVASMTVSNGYNISVNWQGNIGTNDKQKIIIDAKGGFYSITLTNPDVTGQSVTSGLLAYDATADDINTAIVMVADWLVDNITVTDVDVDPNNPELYERIVEFNGSYAGVSMPMMVINSSLLTGGNIISAIVAVGTGIGSQQKLTLYNANSGFYRLDIKIDDVREASNRIYWNNSAEDIKAILSDMSFFTQDDDIDVTDGDYSFDPHVTAVYILTFNKRFGDVQLVSPQNKLVCIPLPHDVPTPPYDYSDDYDDDDPEYSCSPSETLQQQEQITLFDERDTCCDSNTISDSVNIYNDVIIERDLFDPTQVTSVGNRFTIRDLALIKGLKPSNYIPYLRDFNTGAFSSVDYSTYIESKMSIVLVGVNIDSVNTHARLKNKISSNEILSNRVVF